MIGQLTGGCGAEQGRDVVIDSEADSFVEPEGVPVRGHLDPIGPAAARFVFRLRTSAPAITLPHPARDPHRIVDLETSPGAEL